MLNLQVLPDEFINTLKNRGHSNDDISKMSPEQAFTEYCNWNGLTNWGTALWQAVHEFKGASVESTVDGTNTKQSSFRPSAARLHAIALASETALLESDDNEFLAEG
jgi:hypothetical protein